MEIDIEIDIEIDMEIIDAYAHIGQPRFQSLGGYQQQMRSAGITAAVLCSFDSSPDLTAIHDGLTEPRSRFRGIGIPLGNDRDELTAAVTGQLAAGFSGIRLSGTDIAERSWLLELITAHGGIPLVCANAGDPVIAAVLVDHLGRSPDSRLVLGHFGGLPDPVLLDTGVVADLFANPAVSVIFSRQGGYPDHVRLRAERLVAVCGWRRVLWGSESPVLYWRNERLDAALSWIDELAPTREQRHDFLGGNARRLFFDSEPVVRPLTLPFDPWQRANVIRAFAFAKGVDLDQHTVGAIVQAWLADGQTGTFGEYTERLLKQALADRS